MAILDSLFVRLGFQVDNAKLDGFKSKVQGISSTVNRLATLVGVELVRRVGRFIESTVQATAQINTMADAYDISAVKLEALGKVALAHSSNVQSVIQAYKGVAYMAGQAAMGVGRGAKFFQDVGLKAKDSTGKAKSALEVMGDLADKFAKLSTTERIGLAYRMQIDPVTAKMMADLGKEGWMKEVGEAMGGNVLNEEDYKTADKTAIAFTLLHLTMRQLWTLIAVQLGPMIVQLTKNLEGWMKANREELLAKVKAGYELIAKALAFVWKNMGLVKTVVGALIAMKIGAWLLDISMKIFDVSRGVIKFLGAIGPGTLLLAALAAAIGLVVEDLYRFYTGGKSVTGLMLKEFPYAVELVQGAVVSLTAALVALTTGSGPLGLLIIGIGGLAIAANNLRENWEPVRQWWLEMWDEMFNAVARVWNSIPKPLRSIISYSTAGVIGSGDMDTDVLKNAERSRLKLLQFATPQFKAWTGEDEGPTWLAKRPAGEGPKTTNIGTVNLTLPNVRGGPNAARELERGIARLAHGGVGG